MIAHSRDNQRFGDLSKIVDKLFSEILMRLDITNAVRLAACSKEFYRQVPCSRCPNDLCWKLVAYHEFHDHKISCPRRPCTCTEPGCEFSAPPVVLLAHLREAHLLEVHSFQYNKIVRYNSQPLPAPSSPRVHIIRSGDDGTVFAVHFHMRNTETLVSVSCVRMAACLSPRYKVMLWAWFKIDGGGRMPEWWPAEGWQAVEDDSILGPDEAMAAMTLELMNRVSPEELRNHLKVFWTLLPILEPLQTMDYWLRIVKIDDTDNTS